MNNGYDPDELLTVKYLASITHVTTETIKRYIKEHKIPHFKHKSGYRGKYQIRVRREDWRKFLYSEGYNNFAPVTNK